MKLYLASLGCARNLVDSETMLGRLVRKGWNITRDPSLADAIIVNSCSFISDAIDESIDTILELAGYKKTGNCKQLVVAGCLPERFREELAESLPEVDIFLGTGAYDQVAAVLESPSPLDSGKCLLPSPETASFHEADVPRISTSPTAAYVKIAEGCSKHCTYCIIPKLRGSHRSRPMEEIRSEARGLIRSGVKEITLVAQDTTYYGKDLFPPSGLSILLAQLSGLAENVWIRFLYGHPESMDEQVIQTIARHENLCAYFDIPIQHADHDVLQKMGRRYTRDDLRKLFDKIRSRIPEAALRTTIITGFPGETDRAFQTLMDFIREIRFDHLGVFTYSDAKDLPSHLLPEPVDVQTANKRQDLLMNRQAAISTANNRKHVGRTYAVLIENQTAENGFIGRTFFQAPEVDGVTFVHTDSPLRIGDFIPVTITRAFEYDLAGETA